VVDSPRPAGRGGAAGHLADKRERSVVASTAAGQVREVQLRTRFASGCARRRAQLLIPPPRSAAERDMSYSESIALAKEQEEAACTAPCRATSCSQVLRRLAAITRSDRTLRRPLNARTPCRSRRTSSPPT
jgi:LPS-assembly lipoprotein